MFLDRSTRRPPEARSARRAPLPTSRMTTLTNVTTSGLLFAVLIGACMPATMDAEPSAGTGGKSGGSGGRGGAAQGGAGSGGSTGSGGASGEGGNSNPGSGGGSGSGSTGSGGDSGGSTIGSGGSGGKSGVDAGGGDTKSDAKSDTAVDPNGPVPPDGTWANMKNAMSGCIFCHPGETGTPKNTDFGDMTKLHALLLAPSKYIGAGCAIKTLVVPGKPMESLLYVKVAGMPPTGCGERMPKGMKPDQWNIDVIKNWIMAGAPM